MPNRVSKVRGGYRVKSGGKVRARRTTLAKAKRQKRLLDAVEHGYRPRKRRRGKR